VETSRLSGWPLQRTVSIGIVLVVAVVTAAFGQFLIEDVNADEIVVIQSVTGKLTAHTSPGPKLQLFGRTTSYPKRETYSFTADTRFNDGGGGVVEGSIDWIMPLASEAILKIHEQFGSADAVTQNLVSVTTDKSIYMTGPLLSSTESYASRRTELIRWIEDQIEGGIYQTTTETVREINPLTGEEQTVTVASIRRGEDGRELRQEEAYLSSFGIQTANFAVREIAYDQRVQNQIDEQQENIMRVQTAIAQAREAEQRRITVEQQGLANAAAARAEQEVQQARLVTDAETRRQVAELDRQAAAAEREANILRGQGESERRRLIMRADGALEPKLNAWLEAQKAYAAAIAQYQGAWVPSVVTGGGDQVAGSGALQLIELLGIRAARDLSLDLSNMGGNR